MNLLDKHRLAALAVFTLIWGFVFGVLSGIFAAFYVTYIVNIVLTVRVGGGIERAFLPWSGLLPGARRTNGKSEL